MIRFEGYERRIAQIEACMKEYGIADLEDAKAICTSKGIDVDANEALKNATGHYGQWDNAAKYIDPRQE